MKCEGNVLFKNIFDELITVEVIEEMFCSMDPASDFSNALVNVLLICRILPPAKQVEIYGNLRQIYHAASETAEIFDIEFPAIDQFVPVLFEFPLFPVIYYSSTTTIAQSLSMFSEILFDMFPLIMDASGSLESDPESCREYLEMIWTTVKAKSSESETWSSILSRLRKRYEWIPDKQVNGFMRIADMIYDSAESDKTLSLYIYALIALRVPKNESAGVFSKLIEAFSSTRKQVIEMQSLLVCPFKYELLLGSGEYRTRASTKQNFVFS
jgi:hypothetical protein